MKYSFNTGTNAFSTIKYTNIILKVLSILHILQKKKTQNNNSRSNLKELPNIAEDLTSIRDLKQLLEIKHSTGIYWYLYGKSYSVSLLHHFRILRYSV